MSKLTKQQTVDMCRALHDIGLVIGALDGLSDAIESQFLLDLCNRLILACECIGDTVDIDLDKIVEILKCDTEHMLKKIKITH